MSSWSRRRTVLARVYARIASIRSRPSATGSLLSGGEDSGRISAGALGAPHFRHLAIETDLAGRCCHWIGDSGGYVPDHRQGGYSGCRRETRPSSHRHLVKRRCGGRLRASCRRYRLHAPVRSAGSRGIEEDAKLRFIQILLVRHARRLFDSVRVVEHDAEGSDTPDTGFGAQVGSPASMQGPKMQLLGFSHSTSCNRSSCRDSRTRTCANLGTLSWSISAIRPLRGLVDRTGGHAATHAGLRQCSHRRRSTS